MGEPESFVPESFATVGSCRGEGAGKMPLTLGVEYAVERSPHMETVQIVLDKDLLEAADKAARGRGARPSWIFQASAGT